MAEQQRLLEVQAADSHLDALARLAGTLPQLTRIAGCRQALADLAGPAAVAEQAVVELRRAGRVAEDEVAAVRTRLDRDRARLNAGLGSARDMQALDAGVHAELRRIAVLEDAELEVMEALEEAVATQEVLTRQQADLTGDLAREEVGRDAELARIEAEAVTARAERSVLAAGVGAELLTLYGRVRASSKGVGAAALRGNRCLGCSLELNRVEIARIAAAPETEVQRCEECDRILVRS